MPATGYFNQNYYGIPSEADMRGQSGSSSIPSYADILNANTAARTTQITTPGGQTLATSDPNFSQAGDFQQMLAGSPFRKPAQMQDWASSAGVPFDSSAYTKRYHDYWDSQHPNLQGVGGWMHNHPVGTIAAFIAAAAGGAALSGGIGGGAGGGASGSDLGIFSNGGAGGMAGVGGGNAGALANAGGISGGAGAGFLGSTGGSSGLLSQNGGLSSLLGGNSSNLGGLMGGGGQQQPQPIPYSMPNLSGMLGSQTQPQQSSPTFVGLPNQSQMPFIPARGYTPHDFLGAKVWT